MINEIERIKNQINKSKELLNNEKFLKKANDSIIDKERKKLSDFESNLISLIDLNLNKIIQEPFITYFIQEIRYIEYVGEYNDEFFSYYESPITLEEKEILLKHFLNETIMQIFPFK